MRTVHDITTSAAAAAAAERALATASRRTLSEVAADHDAAWQAFDDATVLTDEVAAESQAREITREDQVAYEAADRRLNVAWRALLDYQPRTLAEAAEKAALLTGDNASTMGIGAGEQTADALAALRDDIARLASTPVTPPDPVVAMRERITALLPLEDAEQKAGLPHPAFDERIRLGSRMLETQATSVEGVLAQLIIALGEFDHVASVNEEAEAIMQGAMAGVGRAAAALLQLTGNEPDEFTDHYGGEVYINHLLSGSHCCDLRPEQLAA